MEDIFSSVSTPILAITAFLVIFLIFRQFAGNKFPSTDFIDIGEENSLGSEEMPTDAVGVCQKNKNTLAVLAYGTGKMEYGRTAALTCVKAFLDNFSSWDVSSNIAYFFQKAINQGNRKILENLKGIPGHAAVSAALISGGYLYYVTIGDIKIALMRQGELIAVNDGHNAQTAATKAFFKGALGREQAIELAKRELQTNYLGRDGFKNAEMGVDSPIKLAAGDIIILMSKGVYKCVSWIELEDILTSKATAQHLAEKIISGFERKNVPDKKSASVVVLKYNAK